MRHIIILTKDDIVQINNGDIITVKNPYDGTKTLIMDEDAYIRYLKGEEK